MCPAKRMILEGESCDTKRTSPITPNPIMGNKIPYQRWMPYQSMADFLCAALLKETPPPRFFVGGPSPFRTESPTDTMQRSLIDSRKRETHPRAQGQRGLRSNSATRISAVVVLWPGEVYEGTRLMKQLLISPSSGV